MGNRREDQEIRRHGEKGEKGEGGGREGGGERGEGKGSWLPPCEVLQQSEDWRTDSIWLMDFLFNSSNYSGAS